VKSWKYSVNRNDCHLNFFVVGAASPNPMLKSQNPQKQPLIVLVGPTGVGKTALSLGIGQQFSAEIISMDSMQIYKYMDIGTAKASAEERAIVPHHLVDFVDPRSDYNTNTFVIDTQRVAQDIADRGNIPMLVGGTGLYLQALLFGLIDIPEIPAAIRENIQHRIDVEGNAVLHEELAAIDPESALRVHINDTQRLIRGLEIHAATGITWSAFLQSQQPPDSAFNPILIGLRRERDELYERINRRVEQMLDEGLLGEVKGLLARGYGPELGSMQSIGYRHMVEFCLGHWSWDEAVRLLKRDTRRYAKRQMTWFRDKGITWFHPDDRSGVEGFVKAAIAHLK
jgi:tRNA dimethylallyltransferase